MRTTTTATTATSVATRPHDQQGSPTPTHRRATTRAGRRRTRRYLMASPEHLAVEYAINPWMDPSAPFDPERAAAQWTSLHAAYEQLGHRVSVLAPVPGLPDLVFSANGALVLGDVAFLSMFRHPERRGEEAVHRGFHVGEGRTIHQATQPSEGEGDLLVVGDLVLAGHGFRTDVAAHDELRVHSRREVVSLQLVDERYYHLDTAVGVVDDDVVAWFPPALDDASAEELRRRLPDAIEVDEHDAAHFACNLVSDGRHVIVPTGVERLVHDLQTRGYEVIQLDTSELRLAGGGPKCCTAELHDA